MTETVHPPTDNPFPGEEPGRMPRVPTPAELYDFLNQFLAQWLRLSCQRVDRVEDDIQPLPNERGLMFTEPTTGILVLRTSEDFGKALARLGDGKGASNDFFVEMIVLFWHRFVKKFWDLDSRRLPPALFKRSVPAHWPDRRSEAAVMVLTNRQPIELRLWLDLDGPEMERWKSRGK